MNPPPKERLCFLLGKRAQSMDGFDCLLAGVQPHERMCKRLEVAGVRHRIHTEQPELRNRVMAMRIRLRARGFMSSGILAKSERTPEDGLECRREPVGAEEVRF